MALEPLDSAIPAALSHPRAYPLDASASAGIEHVQTHLSHVFLTRERAYKLHKAASFEFVDFSSRAERNADALRELELNRRLAPSVYLGLAPVRKRAAGFELAPTAQSLAPDSSEHCIVMRRLPAGRDALTLLEQGRLDRPKLGTLARCVAEFHQRVRLSRPAPFEAERWRRRVLDPFLACFSELGQGPLADRAERTARLAARRGEELAGRFERRRREGRAVDGHGDLHLQHVWFESDAEEPLVIDCIAFREDLRRIDAASDVAFLVMDLLYRGERGLGEDFLQHYAGFADDHDLYAVMDFFVAYRAAVRAKVADLASRDLAIDLPQRERAATSAEAHLELAMRALEPAEPGAVIALSGLVGTGKSTVAAELAQRTEGAIVSSDRVRKALCGLSAQAHLPAGWRSGLYRDELTQQVYSELRQRGETIAASGRIAVLDASHARREQRDALRASGASVFLVEVRCAADTAKERLLRRQRAGSDPSDAGPELFESFARSYQAPDEWPPERRFRVYTDRPDWQRQIGEITAALTSQRAPRQGGPGGPRGGNSLN